MTSGSTPTATIVVGIDGTPSARDALALGRTLAALRGATVIAAAVYRREAPAFSRPRGSEAARRDIAKAWIDDVVGPVDQAVQKRTIAASSPARGLHELAEQAGAELVVVGSTHRGPLSRALPGSTGTRLLQEAPCAVAIAPLGYAQDDDPGPRVIAVGYDLTAESEAAVELAADLAGAAGCTIRILTVDDPHADAKSGAVFAVPTDDVGDRVRTAVVRKRDELPAALRADATVLHGRPGHELLVELEKGVDLLVMGSRGYGPLGRALLGSVAAEVVAESPCPVVIVPRAVARAAEPNGADRGVAVSA